MREASRLCFGSLCIGPLQSNLSVKDGADVISRAIGLGVNFIDTAQLYLTYPYIKRAAADLYNADLYNKRADTRPAPTDIIISTKTYAHTRALAKEALDEALRELDRDHIDIFLLHEQESVYTILGHIEALEYLFEQKKAGRIRAVGISTHHVAGVLGAIEFNRTYKREDKTDKLEVIHPMFNMTGLGIIPVGDDGNRPVDQMESALAEAKNDGFFIFSMKPLGGGNLFAEAEKALGFCLDKAFIDSVAVGMKSVAEVEANVNFFKTRRFTEEYYANREFIYKSKKIHIDNWCEGCGKCAAACASGALAVFDNAAVCDHGKCVLCGYCAAACGCFAIKTI